MSKAMVVDDSRAVRMILSRMLKSVGFEVCEAADGSEALARVDKEEGLSLILVDWNMPNLNGLGFVKCLRANPAKNDIAVMMVTTETEIDQVATALEAGANEYVMKPFTSDVIMEKLKLLRAI